MSAESVRESIHHNVDDEPRVPVEVLEAIDTLADDNTASKEEIEAALKFWF
ncbi:hypothetical protein [Haloquadratum walsbyi]|jgi:hypothetical protein|uniref:Uncharacterized protein n=1 Tax=Haloquadratum walsbyi J07HQW2 TaxID=1238425 RepID=U1NDT8_9EURY|nr:hypothetical protein [Haloquadratum walsbyi]ERG95170.1 MAG: hypothetical protein J07HQW2_01618 [Haloquadratum walsbyi J07HQW2]